MEEVPEYIVYWDMFTNLAEEYGLECSFKADFQMIFKEERNDKHFATLLSRMKVVDKNGDTEMNMDQWEACSMYLLCGLKTKKRKDTNRTFENRFICRSRFY